MQQNHFQVRGTGRAALPRQNLQTNYHVRRWATDSVQQRDGEELACLFFFVPVKVHTLLTQLLSLSPSKIPVKALTQPQSSLLLSLYSSSRQNTSVCCAKIPPTTFLI